MNTATKWTDTMSKQVTHCIMQGYPEVDYLDINPKRHTTRAALVRREVGDKSHRWHLLYQKQVQDMSVERLKFYRYLIQKGEYNDA